jgi:hypothetical protein
MKKIDIGQTIQVLANVGVIAGIAFLGFELRQNNELMAADARRVASGNGIEFARDIALNPALAEILAKVEANEQLSDAEQIQIYGLGLSVLRSLQFDFQERRIGTISGEEQFVRRLRVFFHSNELDYDLAETLEIARSQLDPEFVQFLEEVILPYSAE